MCLRVCKIIADAGMESIPRMTERERNRGAYKYTEGKLSIKQNAETGIQGRREWKKAASSTIKNCLLVTLQNSFKKALKNQNHSSIHYIVQGGGVKDGVWRFYG